MGLSQPAIRKMAREMEEAWGTAVFERRREGVSLTVFGQSLVHDARLIVNKLARLESELSELRRNPIRTLRAGAPSYTGMSLRSEEHTSELQSLMRISYAVFCLNKKQKNAKNTS